METLVDYGAASTYPFYTAMQEIAVLTCKIEYLDPWFADGRGNTGSLVIGCVPWKATEVHYKTIKPETIVCMR